MQLIVNVRSILNSIALGSHELIIPNEAFLAHKNG